MIRELGKARVAVVTAAYNAASHIGATLRSVQAQTLSDFEMLVIDDGSTDGTADIIRAVSDRRIRLISIPNGGVSAARNRGLAACTACLVVFLDADDLLPPDALHRMVETLDLHPNHVACFGHHIKIGEDGEPLGGAAPSSLKRLPSDDTLCHLLRKNFIVNGGALCIRMDAAREVGGFDPTLRFDEDREFWCRLATRSDFVLMDEVVLRYRIRSAGANTRLAGTPLRPNTEAIDRMFQAPAIRARFSRSELRQLRHQAEANIHWSAARSQLSAGRLWIFSQYLLVGLFRYPKSLFEWRLIYLFFRGLPMIRYRSHPA